MVKNMNEKYDDPLTLAKDLLIDLRRFNNLKKERWGKIEGSLQMTNKLGTPSEDWIIPPDEKKVERILQEDPDYNKLRHSIEAKVPELIQRESELYFDLKHKLNWVKFTDPLIGTTALNDAVKILEDLIENHSDTD